MARKRKAESELTTLLDFFNTESGVFSSVQNVQKGLKKQKLQPSFSKSTKSRAVETVSKFNRKSSPNVIETIDISDSDSEDGSDDVAIVDSPRKPGLSNKKHDLSLHPSISLENETDDPLSNDSSSAFLPLNSDRFLESNTLSSFGCFDTTSFFEEEEVIQADIDDQSIEDDLGREMSARLDAMSPGEWGLGDDEAISEPVSAGVSECGDEVEEYLEKEIIVIDDDEEADIGNVRLSLSDEDDATSKPCPICGIEMIRMGESASSLHVNKCLDRDHPSSSKMKTPIPRSPLPKPPTPSAITLEHDSNRSESKSKRLNAFSFLMSRNKENEAWKEATEAENSKWAKLKGKGKASKISKKEKREEEIHEIDSEPEQPNGAKGSRRAAPFYKVMQGMPIAVDAFRYGKIPGVTAYLLTHAHSDHYTNLSASWKHGPIYCSETTAKLVTHILSVDSSWVHPLPMNTTTILPDTGGVAVTLIEANHCPGSCLFFFEGKQTVNSGDSTYHSAFVGTARVFRYLHCGDFRACPQHVKHPAIQGKRMDLIYLDTTYLDPKYCFPPQRMVVDACAELTKRIVMNGGDINLLEQNGSNLKDYMKNKSSSSDVLSSMTEANAKSETRPVESPKSTASILVVIGTYRIGKERVVKTVAKALGTSIYCDSRQRKFFECQASSDPELLGMLGDDPLACNVHVQPLQNITSDAMIEYLELWKGRWNKLIGLRPTGWTYTPPTGTEISNLQAIIQRDQRKLYNWSHLRPMRNSTPTVMLYGVPYSEHSSFFELSCFALSIPYVRMIATVNVGSAKSRTKMNSWFEKWDAERKKRAGIPISCRHEEYW